MPYPSPPDFTSAGPDAFNPPAWWSYTRDDGSINVCETTGAALVHRLRAALGLADGTAWDADVQAGLVARAQVYQNAQPGTGWDALVAALSSDAAAQAVGALSLQFGIWLAYYQANGLRLDALALPSTFLAPAWGVALPEGAAGQALACFDPNRDPSPAVLGAADLGTVDAQSTAGVRLHPGEALPAPAPPVPPGPSGLTTPVLVALGLGLVAVVAVVAYANRAYAATLPVSVPAAPLDRPARRTRAASRARRRA